MENLADYQRSLIDGNIDDVKEIIENDYSIGKLHHALSDLSEDLQILPSYQKYAVNRICQLASHYRKLSQDFYHKFHQMNPKYIEVVLNLSNFKA